MTKLYEQFEKWFKTKYPFPASLVVTPEQKEHLRDAYLAGADAVSMNTGVDILDQLIEIFEQQEKSNGI